MKHTVPIACAFVLTWSSGFIGAELARPAGPTPAVLMWRYVVTAMLLLLVAVGLRRRRPRWTEVGQQAVLGLLGQACFLGGVFGAVALGYPPGTVALVCALQPALVTVLGHLGWGDSIRMRQVVGLAMGVVAVGFSVDPGEGRIGAGLLLALASLLGLSGAALLERRWQPRTDVISSLAIQAIVAEAAFAGFSMVIGQTDVVVGPELAIAMIWLLIAGIGGYASFLLCLRRLGATTTSLLLYLTPAVTTLWSWAMFGLVPTLGQWAGLALGMAAVLLAARPMVESTS